MDDQSIIELYFRRSEQAITETDRKYGGYCRSIARNILASREDSEECVSDTYLVTWRAIPPRQPEILSAFLGKITRRIAIDRWRYCTARKRGGGEMVLALEELGDCVSGGENPESVAMRRELVGILNRFLETLPETERCVFLCRYWYLDSLEKIAESFGFTTAKVNSMLHRTRKKLRVVLEREGYR